MFTVVFIAYVTKQNDIVWFKKISIPPPWKGSDFPGGRGGAICLIFQWGQGGHHREIFPEGSRDV